MVGAGKAAFLCCSYDVITDWRHFDPALLPLFAKQLDRHSSTSLRELAIDLYEKDKAQKLADEGLERGAIAFRFVTEMMGIQEVFASKGADLDHTGRVLQIVDDVLDYEEDIVEGETNCLASANKQIYLQELITTNIHQLFPTNTPLTAVLEIAREKAKSLLSN